MRGHLTLIDEAPDLRHIHVSGLSHRLHGRNGDPAAEKMEKDE